MRINCYRLFACIAFTLPALNAPAQNVDTLKPGNKTLLFKYLKNGTEKYVMYSRKNEVYKTPDVLWLRKVNLMPDSGKFRVQQNIIYTDTAQNYMGVTTAGINTFSPIQYRRSSLLTRITTNYQGKAVKLTLDSLKNNKSRSVDFEIGDAAFDFEADHELFKVLPLKDGYKVKIPFYQPGTRRKTKYYTYEVIGTDFLALPGNSKTECWKFISPDYTGGTATWWIEKKTHAVLRQERPMADGGTSVLMLIE